MKKFALALLVVCVAICMSAATVKAATVPTATAVHVTSVCDTGHVHFAKTKFFFHMGLAVGAFHRWIYKPYRAGSFKKGANGRVKALIKAGATGLFIVHELKEACHDANSSDSLKHLLTPLNFLIGQVGVLATKLKSGSFKTTDITSVQTAVGAVSGG